MRARPTWVRKVFIGLGIGTGLALALYVYFKVTAGVDESSFKDPNELDAREAKSMTIGKLEVPPRGWALVNKALGEVDRAFAEEQHWVEPLPMIEIRTNTANLSPELRLYTHRAAATPSVGKP